MKMPGFNAEVSLGRSVGSYRSGALSLSIPDGLDVLPMQIHHVFPLPLGGTPIPGMPPLPPYNPIGTWPTTPPPFGPPPPPVIGGGAIAGGAGAAGGISLWWLIPGAIVGTIIGGAAGLGIESLLTPDLPQTAETPTCRVTGQHYVNDIDENFWGYSRAKEMAKSKAEKMCAGLPPTYCAGACPSGLSCRPKEQELISDRTSYGFWTHIYYKFACTCGCR